MWEALCREGVVHPFTLEYDTLRRSRSLLELAGVLRRAHAPLQAVQDFLIEAGGVQKVARLPDDLLLADGIDDGAALLGFRREAQVGVPQVFRQDVAGQIAFVKALHDDNNGAVLGVI